MDTWLRPWFDVINDQRPISDAVLFNPFDGEADNHVPFVFAEAFPLEERAADLLVSVEGPAVSPR